MDTNHSQIEQQFAAMRATNQQLAETVRIRNVEIGVLRGHIQMLSGEVIKVRQDSGYAEQAVSALILNGSAVPLADTG